MGGLSSEREVSLSSGQEVLDNLDPKRYDVTVFDPATDLPKLVAEANEYDLAFPLLHGRYGEDGTIQGLLELLKLPYVGSGVMSSAMCMDKKMTKDLMRFHNLTVTTELLVMKGQDPFLFVEKAMKQFYGFPMVVKPVSQGSSVGMTIAKSEAEAIKALRVAWELDDRVMIEPFIQGRELTCAVIGNNNAKALPPIEIKPAEGHVFFDYEAKYQPGQAEEVCPADLTDKETAIVKNIAIAAHKAMACRGISRTDMILREELFYVLEVNTLPGMTKNSLVPRAAAAAGYSLPSLLDELISLAFERE
jgi:D-alanine-D-alanine ligase